MGQQESGGMIRIDDVPSIIQEQGWVGRVGVHQSSQTRHHRREILSDEPSFRMPWREPCSQEESVLFIFRDVEGIGETQDHFRCGIRPPILEITDVACTHIGACGKGQLTQCAALAPPAKFSADE
ncbi:hypothetical protein GCM10009803_15330 [Microbacterium ginsengiterrae]